ncbi:hypothetical protein EPUS_03256 [Endocarpon pusillum Z07020]|uniref:Uncharacterized protein n=1 Tax=Endocarpon pusillum (strain Z07020 / HMAS-L-300199) TaxID=1263415 RepID=U1GBE7_ENDPU|nr:uncharacterized protein EPUS_03256 [Endocarpon pusillum Z07020]ERF74872.1 hypothetical protein EPUS_03256 [Endocarpon pusillum Z07020]
MEANSQSLPLPCEEANEGPSKDFLDPTILVLAGQSVVCETAPAIPLYQMNWNVTSLPPKGSSVVFERVVEHGQAETAEGTAPSKPQNRHLFYLAHPPGAQLSNEKPAYYITSVLPEMLGNISLEAVKSRLQKPELKARLPEEDHGGIPVVAYEDGKGEPHRLVVTAPMERRIRDALVATWCLRLWHDTAESRQARTEALERWTPPESMRGYGDMKMAKTAGALGAVAGAGGGAC